MLKNKKKQFPYGVAARMATPSMYGILMTCPTRRRLWYAIKLHTGDLSKWETSYHDPHKHVLMKIDWEDD